MSKIIYLQKTVKKSNLPLVIGFFGCLHKKHMQLFPKKKFNILTFDQIPRKQNYQFYSFKQRIELLKATKPNNIYVFSLLNNNLTAHAFTKDLLKKIDPSSIIVGKDFRFGRDFQDVNYLAKYFHVQTIDYDPDYQTSKISQLLRDKNIDQANKLLFQPYHFYGAWIKGDKNGRKISFPTINLAIDNNCFLPDGVYCTVTKIRNKKYPSMTFIGQIATKGIIQRKTIESHLIDTKILPRWCFGRYARHHIETSFFHFLRDGKKFQDLSELQKQLEKDRQQTSDFFEHSLT